MDDISTKLIVWGAITLFFTLVAFLCYKWISNVRGFENNKKIVATGLIVCVLALSSMIFLPLMYSGVELHQVGTNLLEQIQSAQMDSEDTASKFSYPPPPFARTFSLVLAALSYKFIRVFIFVIPILAALLIIFFVVLVILNIREPKRKQNEKDNRRHLFEYNSEIISKLNKNSER